MKKIIYPALGLIIGFVFGCALVFVPAIIMFPNGFNIGGIYLFVGVIFAVIGTYGGVLLSQQDNLKKSYKVMLVFLGIVALVILASALFIMLSFRPI